MPTARIDDFSDRLSPMLVKELRQGLRARTFIAVFIALQALLALIILSAASAASYDNAGLTITRIIFIFFSLAVLVVQPLRGIGAVAVEIKAGTIDLMVLTRLSAWRIVFGKWIALVSQSALLLTAIIPYLILRYFFGEMELLGELILLAVVFLLSMLLTAVTVGLSATPSILIRGILPVLGSPVLVITLLGICMSPGLEEIIDFFTFTDPDSTLVFGACVALGLFLTWAALDFGAGLIAPLAENRTTIRRLIALVFAACWTLACLWIDSGWMLVAMVVLLTPTIATALTEADALLPVVCSKFTRFGIAGRLAGRLFYPGWPSGVVFLLPLAALLVVAAVLVDPGTEETVVFSSWFGTLVLPAACIVPFERKLRNLFAVYALVLVASLLFTLVLLMLSEAMGDTDFLWLFAWLPATHGIIAEEGLARDVTVLAGSLIWTSVLMGALLVCALTRQPAMLATEQAATAAAAAQTDGADAGEPVPEKPIAVEEIATGEADSGEAEP
jgi:hypothetical protein